MSDRLLVGFGMKVFSISSLCHFWTIGCLPLTFVDIFLDYVRFELMSHREASLPGSVHNLHFGSPKLSSSWNTQHEGYHLN